MKKIDFNKMGGLIPVIIQEKKTGEVLMLGYMNDQAYQKTLQTKWVWFWSRSKNRLWQKGEISGNRMLVLEIKTDCDSDAILITIELMGKYACHLNHKSCFEGKGIL